MTDPSSPCIKICLVDSSRGLCSGCGRTLKEIGDWLRLTDDERRRVKLQLPERLRQLARKDHS